MPMKEILEPSVPPRNGVMIGSMSQLSIAWTANSTGVNLFDDFLHIIVLVLESNC